MDCYFQCTASCDTTDSSARRKGQTTSKGIYFYGGSLVSFKKEHRRQRVETNNRLEKAVQVDVEDQHSAVLIIKAVPDLLEDKSNHILATELTYGESTIKYLEMENFECFDDIRYMDIHQELV